MGNSLLLLIGPPEPAILLRRIVHRSILWLRAFHPHVRLRHGGRHCLRRGLGNNLLRLRIAAEASVFLGYGRLWLRVELLLLPATASSGRSVRLGHGLVYLWSILRQTRIWSAC